MRWNPKPTRSSAPVSKVSQTRSAWMAFLMLLIGLGTLANSPPPAIDLSDPPSRAASVTALRQRAQHRKSEALDAAREQGWVVRGVTPDNRVFELMQRDAAGAPVYNTTLNVNAAISTAVNAVRNIPPDNLSGSGIIAGVWDAGAVRPDHQEFVSPNRVQVMDGAGNDYHATHVGGTIGAKGQEANALGMAPSVTIHSYDWSSDLAEMAAAAATAPGQGTNIYLSNHSYGYVTGWTQGSYSGTNGWHWFGVWPDREDRGFGQYGDVARDWDTLCFNAPYFLPFKAAGNDRNDGMPGNGETFYYWDNNAWQPKAYDSATDPFADQHKAGGFNTVSSRGNAKNIMTVGAVNDAVSGGNRNLGAATMATFSGWGPTDDGRIKPDIVANGVGLYSSVASGTSAYTTMSGTSMAAPNAAGSAVLLVEYYRSLFPGQDMRAATLKGLIIHTADDLGRAGPDYEYGWGLMNTRAAADHIFAHAVEPDAAFMVADSLPQSQTQSHPFLWDGVSPIRVTLSWTDPPGTAQSGLNSTTIVLVNDLDLRVIDPADTVHFPYLLDPGDSTAAATVGDNIRDNVEQVFIPAPGLSGMYTVQISHKGTLSGGEQPFSLLISGTTGMSQDFTIAGHVRTAESVGIPGVVMNGLPGPPVTDAQGYYQKMVATGWSGTVTPIKSGYALYPGARVYDNVLSGQLDQDYLALQISASATHTAGDIPTDRSFTALPGASGCPGTLTVSIPIDAELGGVDVSYNMTTAEQGWMNEQRSWLRCVSPGGTGEPQLTEGEGYEGTYLYTRTGLDIANGVTGGGDIVFELHAGRTWGDLWGNCDTTYNKVDNGTWTVTVHFSTRTANTGTPHAWLAQHDLLAGGLTFEQAALADPDGDGHANWQEHIADTDPNDPQSVFRIEAFELDPPRLYFHSTASRMYGLFGRTSLISDAWAPVPGAGPRSGVDGPDSFQDANEPPYGPFYRLQVELP